MKFKKLRYGMNIQYFQHVDKFWSLAVMGSWKFQRGYTTILEQRVKKFGI